MTPNRILKSSNTLVAFALVLLSSPTWSRPLEQLVGNGTPELAEVMGPDTYVPVQMRQLSKPVLLWVDLDWLKENGFTVPATGITRDFERQILNVLGHAAPIAGEPESAYLDSVRTGYADRYGGFGIGTNGGSGRAQSEGMLQCKGCGRTELVHPDIDIYHSSGSAILNEGIGEVIASQIAHRELPYGANRVIALIATGTTGSINGGTYNEPRVLIFREDPIRPAHFIINSTNKEDATEQRRFKWMNQQLVKLLPQKAGATFSSDADQLAKGLTEMLERMAETLAFSYARGLHHGAFTPSNLELSGRAVDFGSFIQYLGYPQAYRVDWIGPFGSHTVVTRMIKEFLDNVRNGVPEELKSAVMTSSAGNRIYLNHYQRRVKHHMAVLAGFPEEILVRLPKRNGTAALGSVLVQLSKVGNETVIDASSRNPGKTGTYDLPKILVAMAAAINPDAQGDVLKRALEEAAWNAGVQDIELRDKLVRSYQNLLDETESKASRISIPKGSVRSYLKLASVIRNDKIKELYRGQDFWQKFKPLMTDFAETMNPYRIRAQIDADLRTSRRTFRDSAPFELVLKESRLANGEVIREFFNLRTGAVQQLNTKAAACNSLLSITALNQAVELAN